MRRQFRLFILKIKKNMQNSSKYTQQNRQPLSSITYKNCITSNQNYMPNRQGKGFKIDLGLNYGPFLPQDISSFNQKSKQLLAARQVLQTHISMSCLLQNLQTKQNMMIKSLPQSLPTGHKIQNFYAQISYLTKQLCLIEDSSYRLKLEEIKFAKELKRTQQKIQNINNQIIQNCVPIFHSLIKSIRNTHEQQKNLFQRQKREIEGLEKFRSSYLDQIVQMQKRIIGLEINLGVTTIGEDQQISESLQENYDTVQ